MELDKCHLLFGCEIMKFFSTGLLLLIVFGSLEGSTIPHKRTVRALNATIQTHFNGTIQRTNPCTNKEVERSSYRGCHEFHHHSKESNWSDYSHKCATLISNFFQAISNLVTFKDRQSGTFDLNINTKVSHKTDGNCEDTKKPICPTPTVIVESTDCEVLPSTSCNDLPEDDIKGSEICALEEADKDDEPEDEKCSVGSEISVNEQPQTEGSSSITQNDKLLDVSYSGETKSSDKTIPEQQPTQEVNSPGTKPLPEEFQPETIPTYDNYPSSEQPSETTNIGSSVSNAYDDKLAPIIAKPDSTLPSSEAPSTVTTSAPKENLYIDISETPQQSSDSKDYASDYKSQADEDKTEVQPSLSTTQPENSNDKVVPEDDSQAIEFSDKIALYNVHEPQLTTSPWTQNHYRDSTIPLTFGTKSDYDVQPTAPPQYQSDSYDEQIQPSQAVTFAPVQPEPENYVNQYDQVASDLPTFSPPKDGSLEFSDQLAVYNVRQPQPESPSSSSLLNEPTSIQPSVLPESHSENYVNYEDGLVSNQLPTSMSPPKGGEPSVEFSDQLAVYNVRQPYSGSTSIQPSSSESQTENYDSYEDETESNESTTSSSPSVNVEPSIEFSDQLAVYNIRAPTTAYPPTTVSQTEPGSTQPSASSETQPANYMNYEDETVEKQSPTSPPSEDPSVEFSDQLAVYNVREPLPGTTTLSPIVESSMQPSPQSDNYMNYETEVVPNQIPTTSSPQHEDNQYVEYSDQLAVYNVREPLPGTTTLSPIVESSMQPSSPQSDNYMNYETEVVPNQTPTTSSPQPEDNQYVEYSDQLAVYNVREPLPTTTTSSPAVNENIPSSFATTLSPSFSSYELDTYDSQKTQAEPQPTFAPMFEEVTSQPQPSSEPASDYYGEYNEQTLSNQVSPFTTPAGKVYPTTMPSNEYMDNNGPESPSSDYSSTQDIGGFVSTSLPSSSYDTSSFNNIELQYDSQPTSTLLPSEAQQSQVFSDQVSDIREPQSDSSVSDGPISDMVTAISPIAESESSIPYDDGSSLTDSQQIIPSESQQEESITNEYPVSSSSNQPSPNNYEIYDEQSSTSVNEAPMTSANEPITYQQSPIDVITASPSSIETENFGIYDDSKFPAEPQGTYPPKIENESFANYDDNDTSTAGQASVSMKPLSENDSSENEPTSSEEGSSSQEEDGNVSVSDDQGLLPLSSNTFRPTVQIETTVNYADQTPFRPIGLPSSIGPLQENNIIYDEGIFRNETEPSAVGGEEADNSLNVSSELTNQNEGKEFESSTTLTPELSSDAPKINNYMNYEDDVQPSSQKFDPKTTISNDYSTSFLPSTPSSPQEIITTPSTCEAMPETYTDYEYSKTDFNSQTTFPPQTESVIYDDHSSQDQSLTQQQQQQQSVDYAAYDNQIQSTASPNPADQEMIEFSDQLSIYNVPETAIESSPALSELFSSAMVTTTQSTIPSDGKNLEIELEPTFSTPVEPQNYDEQRYTQPLPSKDLNLDTYVNYEDTVSSSQLPATTLPPNEVEPSLEYSDQPAIYNVPQPQPESPSSSSLLNEPTSIQPSVLPESHSENYVNYEDGLVSNQLPISMSPPKGDEPSVEFSDQLAVYNVRQPYSGSTSIQPSSSESQTENYDSYEDETESNESTTSSSPSVNAEPSIEFSDAIYNAQPQSQFSSPSPQLKENIPSITISTLPPSSVFDGPLSNQPTSPEVELESEEVYEDEIVSSTLPSPKEEPSIEVSDELAIYNVRQPSTASPLPSVIYVESSSSQPSVVPQSQPDNYVSYDDEQHPSQTPTTSSPSSQPEGNQYVEYSDELAVYNVREPLPGTTTSSPVVESSMQPSSPQSDNYMNYETEVVPNQIPTTSSPQHEDNQYVEYSDQPAVYNVREPLPGTTTLSPIVESSMQPSSPQSDNYMNYETEVVSKQTPTTSSPQPEDNQYVEYSDQLAVYNVREPLPSTTTSSPDIIENIPSSLATTLPPLFSSNRIETYDEQTVGNELQATVAPEMYDEPTSAPVTSFSPTETQPESYVNYESGESPTSLSPPKSVEPFVEYSDELSIYNVRQPEYYSSSPSPLNENLVTTTAPNLPVEVTNFQPTLASESESQMYDEPTSSPASSASQSDVYTNYDDTIVSNEFQSSPSPVEPSLEKTGQLISSSIAPSSSIEEAPFVQYSDQLSIYNARQPSFETTSSPSPSEIEDVSSGATPVSTIEPFPSRDSFQADDPRASSSDYVSTPPQQLTPESQVTYEDYTVQKEESPSTLSTQNLAQSQDFFVPPSNYSAEQEFDYQATSPPQPQDNYVAYEDQTVSNAITTSSPLKVEPSLEYSDQLAVYNVREPVFESTTTLSPSSLTDKITSPQPSSSQPHSDSYEEYEDETVSNAPSTTLSQPAQTYPSAEYSDQLAAFNVLGPAIVPISAPEENIPSGHVTTSLPPVLNNEPTSPQSSSSESQSDSDEDYEDETVSTPSPVTGVEPSVELSDELSIYNVRKRPSEMTTPSSLIENIASEAVATFAPYLPSDKFENYDYQPAGFESQPTFSPEGESPMYNQPISVPTTSSQPQDSYVNYENEIKSNEPMTTLRPPVDVEYSDELAIYNVRSPTTPSSSPSPLLNENIDTVSTFAPSPVYDEATSASSTSPEDQPGNYLNYEDQLASNKFPITYSPSKEEPSVLTSDQTSINTAATQSLPSDGYDYDSQVEYTDSQTTVPTELTPQMTNQPTTVQPLTSSESQPEQYVNYEDKRISTPSPTPTSSINQVEPSVEYSDELAVYNVREPRPGTTTSSPIVETSIEPSPSQSDNYMNYETEVVPNQLPTTSSPSSQPESNQYAEYSDQLAVYNVREPLPGTTTSSPIVESSMQPSSSQSDNYMNYETEVVPNQTPTTSSPSSQPEGNQYVEYSDELAVYNVREPLPGTTTPSPVVDTSIQPLSPVVSENLLGSVVTTLSPSSPLSVEPISVQPSSSGSQSDSDDEYEDESNETSTTLSTPGQLEPSVDVSDELAIYNVRQPSTASPLSSVSYVESGSPQTSVVPESQPDNYVSYDDEQPPSQTPTASSPSPQPVGNQYVEYSDELAVYNVRKPEYSSSPSPLNEIVTTAAPSLPSNGFGTYDSQVVYTDFQPTSSPQSDSQMYDEPTSSSSSSESKPENYVNYEDQIVPNQASSSLSPPVQVEPSVEYSDELAVYNVREPVIEPTSPPVLSESVPSSVFTTLPPSSSLIVEPTSTQSSSSESQSDSDEDYEDETGSTPSPVTGVEPSVEVSDELSIYNIRQRPSEISTPSPFNNNVINNLITTISPYFTFKEPSSQDNLNTISQTTVSPEYVSDTYDEESAIQPSKSYEDDSQALSDETTSKDSLPETLSNFAEQTITNVIQSTQSPDLSNQVYSKNEVESQKVSFTTVQPKIELSVTSDPSFESSAGQEFDYQPTLSPEYETSEEAMTTPSSSRRSQDNYVVYEDQTVSNELTTSSPVNEIEPSSDYPHQLASTLLPETSASYFTSTPPSLRDSYTTPPSSEVITESATYTDYEGSTANANSPPTQYDEPGQVQTSTSPQPQIVNYDYYNDQNKKPEESSALPPTTEIDTDITLTEVGPTFPPNFESQIFDKSDPIQHTSSEIQPNYGDYEDSVVSNQTPTSPSPQTEVQPSIEFSDQLAVYNVRQPYLEPTTMQPSSSSEPQPDNYDTYEDQVIVNEPSTPQKVEHTVTQPTSTPEGKTQMYDEPTLSSATSSEPQPEQYVNYEDERISTSLPSSTSSTNQLDPSVEYSDELAVYNVREPLPGTTSPPVVSENGLGSMVTTLSPTSSLSVQPISAQPTSPEVELESEEDYEDEIVSSTLPSPKEEPSIEVSDELAIYNVRQPSTVPPLPSVSYVESSSPQSSVVPESQPDNYVSYDDEKVSNQTPTTSSPSPQPEGNQYVEYSDELAVYNVREPLPGTTTLSPVVETSIEPSSSQSDNYMNYETEVVTNQLPTTSSPQPEDNQYVEYSDQLAVYNVREPLPGTTTSSPIVETSIQPSSPVVSENLLGSVVTTLSPSSPLSVEPISIQPSSSESQSYSDDEYEDESNESSTTLSTPGQLEPSVEVSDELAIYNVRQPSTVSPLSSVSYDESSSPQPSVVPESQPDNYVSYDDEQPPSQTPTASSPSPQPVGNQYVEYSDELAVYNVRDPVIEPTSPPVLSENVPSSVFTTLPPSSSLVVEPTSPQSSSSESQSDSDEDYEDETGSTPSPVTGVEPSVEVFDDLSIYNVRQRPSEISTPSPFNNNVINNIITTISPYFTSSSNDNEGSTFQSSVTFEPEPEIIYQPYFGSTPASVSQPDNYISYDDEIVSNGLSTSSPPTTDGQPSIEIADELAVYNVRQPSTASPPSSVSYIESSSPQSFVAPQSQSDNYVSYDDERLPNQIPTTLSPQPEGNQYVEYSDELAVYNVREPLPGTTTPSPIVETSIQPSSPVVSENLLGSVVTTFSPSSPLSVEPISIQPSSSESQSGSDDEYEDESNESLTTLSTPGQVEPSVEVSDELAIYNVRQPSTASPLPSVSYVESSSSQPSVVPQSQPDNYVSYDDEQPPSQTPTTSSPSPQPEGNQYVEYSDELAVYNVREPLPGTTTLSPVVETSIEPSSQSDNYMNYETEVVPNQLPTTSSPSSQPESDQYAEYSDQLAVYNVREPLPSTTASSPAVNVDISSSFVTTSSPFFESDKLLNQENDIVASESTFAPQYEQAYDETKTTQSSFDSQPGSYEDYEGQFPATNSPSQDIKTTISNSIISTAAPSLPTVEYDTYDNHVGYTDSQTTVPTELTPQMTNQPTTVQPLTSSESQQEQYVNYEDERISTPSPTSTSSINQVEPSVEYSDELAVYNVREPRPGTTTLSPVVETSIEPSPSQSDNYMNYETEVVPNQLPTTSSPSPQPEGNQYVEYSDELAVYNVREPLPGTTTSSPIVETSIQPSSPVVSENLLGSVVTTLSPSSPLSVEPISVQPSSSESQSDSDDEYEDESNESSTTLSTPKQVEPFVEVSDELAIYNVRQPSTVSPLPSVSYVESSSPQTSVVLQSQPDNYVSYDDEQPLNQIPTTSSPQSEGNQYVEYSDELAVYNVREPLPGTTTLSPAITENIANSVVTTLSPPSQPISVQPPSSNLQSGSYSYEDYKDETVSKESSTTFSTPVQVEPSVEYSDQLAVYDVREPLLEPTSAPVIIENLRGSIVTTLSPSSSESQSDSDDDYENELNESPTTPSTPIQVEPSVEVSDELAIYNVRQPEYSSSPSPVTENFANDLVTTVAPSFASGESETNGNQVVYTDFQPTFSPQSDSQMYDEPTSIPASSSKPETDNYVNYEDKIVSDVAVTSASPPVDVDIEYSDELAVYNVRQPSTVPPLLIDIATIPQNSVQSEQNDFYTYDDRSQSSDTQTTFSPDIEYDEAPTSSNPQNPSVQPLLETMVTTFQPLTESQINKAENKTSTPSKQQEASTFPPLYPFIPLNQPSYSLPVESKVVSEQQDQVISNQVVNSPLVPSSELNSDKRSNNLSNLVKSQETRPIDGVENTQRDTPQPEPFVPDQSNPSNEPDRIVIRDKL